MEIQTCYATHDPLSQDALCLHRNVLDSLGWGPRRYEEDEYGDEVDVGTFIDMFKDHLKHHNIHVDFSRHARLSTYAANVPQFKDFEDALFRARSFELSRILKLTHACYTDQRYRTRFMKNPCFDGAKNSLTQATEFFVEKYHGLENTFCAIKDQFNQAKTKEDYLNVLDQMLDLRYTKSNRRPNTWTCYPKAQIHPNDLGQFE